jgi:Neurotransmitter-gated ion-channel ligand binding domain
MKKGLFILTFFGALSYCSVTAQSGVKDTCFIGVYVNSIYDFKLDDKSFMADMWIWANYKNDSLNFENDLEVPNSKATDFSHFSVEKKGEWNWMSQKCKAEMMHQWDVSCFPFDKQLLRIEIEDSEYDINTLVYKADTTNSKLNASFNSKEWMIESFTVKESAKTYHTTYGNPEITGSSTYPRVVAEILIKRNNSWLMLGKMLTGAYVAFLISALVFFVSSENQDSRFGLCVGGLFAAIGNKYIVESVVPSSNTNSLMDNVHNLTFTFILLIVLIIIISLRLFESGDDKKKALSLKLDKWAFVAVIGLFVLINLVLIYFAAN